jgi:hypothetical protein
VCSKCCVVAYKSDKKTLLRRTHLLFVVSCLYNVLCSNSLCSGHMVYNLASAKISSSFFRCTVSARKPAYNAAISLLADARSKRTELARLLVYSLEHYHCYMQYFLPFLPLL